MQVSTNFVLQEFVPQATYAAWGERSTRFVSPKLFLIAQALRDAFGPLAINDWHTGGQRNYCGWRPHDCPEGAAESSHKRGMAIDCHFSTHSEKQVYDAILADKAKWAAIGITTLENIFMTPTWVHVAMENWGTPLDIVVVAP